LVNSKFQFNICQLRLEIFTVKKKTKSKTIYDPQYEHIITRLRDARKEAGLKQEYVADKIGKYASYLSKIENGDRRVDVLELLELADLYKKDIDFFVPKNKKLQKVDEN